MNFSNEHKTIVEVNSHFALLRSRGGGVGGRIRI
jgi:hypothetical protein